MSPSMKSDCLKLVLKPTSNSSEEEILAITVVVVGKDGEVAIERAREILKLDRASWKVTRIVEGDPA